MTVRKTNHLHDAVGQCCKGRPCLAVCPLLESSAPADVARAVLSEGVPKDVVDRVSTCSLCGLCNEACPDGVDIQSLMKAARTLLIQGGAIDAESYRHLWVDHDWNVFTLYRKEYGLDEGYRDLIKDRCQTLFLPGCMLANEGPGLVRLATKWLARQGEDVGVSIQCCGATLDEIGLQERVEGYSTKLWAHIRQTGARRVVTACPTCQARIVETDDNHDIAVVSLYQLMAESGLRVAAAENRRITVHDSCSDRDGQIGSSVRELLQGNALVEMRHHGRNTICCGSGGLVSAIDPELCRERAEQRLKEVEDAEADTCVTYCMSCAHRMAGSETRDTVRHILELIFDERVQHQEFDARALALFEGEHGEENCRLLQDSKLLA